MGFVLADKTFKKGRIIMMKKLMSILTAMAMLASIWACKPTSGKETPDSTAKPNTDISGKADETSEAKKDEVLVRDPSLEDCEHTQGGFLIDNEKMIIFRVPEKTPVKAFNGGLSHPYIGGLHDPALKTQGIKEFVFHYCEIFKDGKPVTEGYIEEGMKVRVYHCNSYREKKFYGEYTVTKLDSSNDFWINSPISEGTYFDYTVDVITFSSGYHRVYFTEKGTSVRAVDEYFSSDELSFRYIVMENGKKVTDGLLTENMVIYSIYRFNNWELLKEERACPIRFI